MSRVLYTFILSITVCSATFAETAKGLLSAHEILERAFSEKRIMAIAGTAHQGSLFWKKYVKMYLDMYGDDTDLRYVMIENSSELADFYHFISLNDVDIDVAFKKYDMQPLFLEGSDEFKFTITELVQQVRQINSRRPAGKKLIIAPLDGMNFLSSEYARVQVSSHFREKRTAANFTNRIKTMAKSERALVIYHMAHLAKKIELQLYSFYHNEWTWGAGSWMSYLAQDLQNQIFVTFIDQDNNNYHPEGFSDLTVVEKIYRNPQRGEGLLTATLGEEGNVQKFIKPNHYLSRYVGGAKLPDHISQLFDAIIFEREILKSTNAIGE